ncbi:MAG: CRTAC1 family protein [Mariniblastus sp.]
MRHYLLLSILLLTPTGSLTAQNSVVPKFIDQTASLGLELGGTAACWADLNNDGWSDLCCGGTVWKNEQGQKFSRLATGLGELIAADFNNDGFVDLFSWSNFKLYQNIDGKEFVPFDLPDLPASVSLGACWADFNRDGYIDLYVGGYEDWGKGITYPDLFLMNEKGAAFRLARTDSQFRARGVTACDYDLDGDPDIYVSNYRLQPNLLWVNDGAGNFENKAPTLNAVATSDKFGGGHSIGAAWGDFDNDGLLDLFAGNFAHRDSRGNQPQSRFLKNLGPDKGYTFEDRGTSGVFYQESYASPTVGDFDNDGNLDLFFTTVYGTASFGKKNNAVLYKNQTNFKFSDVTADNNLENLPPTYQAAWADYDRDGDLDLITANKLYQNQLENRDWLKVLVHGNGTDLNRSAVSTVVKVIAGKNVFARAVEAGTGQGNQNEMTLHFGLGNADTPVSIEIMGPNQKSQTFRAVDFNRLVTIQQLENGTFEIIKNN